ncbi:hypothetical protein H257_03350 [Aphanomyces astaci]|uniref:Uncharacterized protein n=1 Tax=Aphanomyces astaci TaxID=112090 RepID=W4GXC4_APHAT|nr:hypothetical protein H257_03350 [Aphanomyces astaci]ETV83986.1 hypothetical protein H257_03350 [Aphanomyces astaci]|eukprot:XP_009825678.1 hypothetical protein H257_03350 [Aphanomyces astaci]
MNPANTNILYGRQFAELFFTPINDEDSISAAAHLEFTIFVLDHPFNLFVSDLLSNHDVVIQKVNILMRKLRNILPVARLRRLTPLQAKTLNATRWTSAFSMLTGYSAIKTYIGQMGDKERRLGDIVHYHGFESSERLLGDIVHCHGFESSVVKILRGNEEGMSATEVVAVQPLACSTANQVAVAQPTLSWPRVEEATRWSS